MEKKGYFILRKATIHNEDIKIISIDAFDYTEAILMSQKKIGEKGRNKQMCENRRNRHR